MKDIPKSLNKMMRDQNGYFKFSTKKKAPENPHRIPPIAENYGNILLDYAF